MNTFPRRRAQKPNSSPSKRTPAAKRSGPSLWHWIAVLTVVPAASFLMTVYATDGAHAMRSAETRYAAPLLHKVARTLQSVPKAAKPLARIAAGIQPSLPLPPGSASLANPNAPITVQAFPEVGRNGVPFTMVIGGEPGSYRAPIRQAVGDMVDETRATAGLNGTFFANASLTGTDNLLIGPSLCANDPGGKLVASPYDVKPQLAGRPLVLLSPGSTKIVPYDQGLTRSDVILRGYQPGLTDAFLGGVWLVRDGVAADADTVETFHMKDAEDMRRRAFFAVMSDGRPALGATTYVASSSQLAAALAAAGVRQAVLLDSGFSTSLVFQSKVLVTGHTAPGIPSRPVPQALLLYGQPTEQSVQLADALTPSVAHGFLSSPGSPTFTRHRAYRSAHRLRHLA